MPERPRHQPAISILRLVRQGAGFEMFGRGPAIRRFACNERSSDAMRSPPLLGAPPPRLRTSLGIPPGANALLDRTLGQGAEHKTEGAVNPKAYARLSEGRLEVRPRKQPANTGCDEGNQRKDSRKASCQRDLLKGGTLRILSGSAHLKALALLVVFIGKLDWQHSAFFPN